MKCLGLLIIVALLATGCGGGEEPVAEVPDIPDETVVSDEYPACQDVWVPGQILPEDFEGCLDAEADALVVAVTYDCVDGSRFTAYEDRMWAVLGGEISEGSTDSPEYGEAFDACMSE